MSLKLMFITNRPDVMRVAEESGIDRIFIDLETLGKEERQPKMDTVKSCHTIEDVKNARNALKKAELLVRINSIWEGSQKEINDVIAAGADVIMLPYFKTVSEVESFLNMVNKRVKTCLLFETSLSVENVDKILLLSGIDEAHIGINDMHLCYGLHFMFELLCNGTVEYLCKKFKEKNIPYGFGGIARLGFGDVPAEMIIAEHYRLGSSMAIVSRQFCKVTDDTEIDDIKEVFKSGIIQIRDYEKSLLSKDSFFFEENKKKLSCAVEKVVARRIANIQ